MDQGFNEIKNRKDDEISCLSGEVDLAEQMSNCLFIEDLRRLAGLNNCGSIGIHHQLFI